MASYGVWLMKSPDNSRGLGAALSKVGGFVAGLPRIAVVAAALALGGGGYALQHTNFGVSEQEFQTLYSGEDECTDFISQAKKAVGGDKVEIPESITGDDGKVYRVGYVGSWEGRVGPLRGLGLTGDVLKMADFYDANGGKTDSSGFERIGDIYIVALGQGPFVAEGQSEMHVGDLVEIEFDDGTTIGAIVGDMKGRYGVSNPYDPSTFNKVITGTDPQGRPDTSCGWGHAYSGQVHVLEFWGYGSSGDPMSGPIQSSTGGSMTRVTAITNHGMAAEFAQFAGYSGGAIGGNLVSMKSLSTSKAASAFADCETSPKYDNSTLAAALVSYSYSQRRVQPNSEPSTKLYQEVCEAVLGTGDCTYSMHYHSCDRGVAAAVHWTGADLSFPAGPCSEQLSYLRSSSLWEPVSSAQGVSISGDDDWASAHGLEPGDVGVTNGGGGHTLAYVGNEAVTEGYESFIKGNDGQTPGTGGDIGEPAAGSAWVMASYGSRGACIQNDQDARSYYFFRYKGDYPDKDKYADVGSSAMLKGASSKGTPCECGEEVEECEDLGGAEVIAAVLEHIADHDVHGYNQGEHFHAADESYSPSCSVSVNGGTVEVYGGDTDCSGGVSQACIAAGYITKDQTFSTREEDEVLTGAGFTKIPFSAGEARRGDVLWMQGHTGVCIGDGMQADAGYDENGGISGGTPGDQTGGEQGRRELYSSWEYIYRPPSSGSHGGCSDQEGQEKSVEAGSLDDNQRDRVDNYAKSQVGKNMTANELVHNAYDAAGISIPTDMRKQMKSAPTVTSTGSVSEMAPGDVVVWDEKGRRSDVGEVRLAKFKHVAIYIGNGEIVEGTSSGVQVRKISDNEYSYSVTW